MAKKFIVKFNQEKCKGCELCCTVCPKKLITTASHPNEKGYRPACIEERQEECIGCANCAVFCPDCAIEIFEEE